MWTLGRVTAITILCAMGAMLLTPAAAAPVDQGQRMEWWRDNGFGMFVHWGLYAIPAGMWKGQQIGGVAEWIMSRAEIPLAEYALLARQFNPERFDADGWVRIANDAGMRYIVVTAKHHDGFAMYDSEVSSYNIVDATPFGRDPIAELAAACRKHGIKLCLYYSHGQDWEHPDGDRNHWDFDPDRKVFQRYFDEKVVPQVRELLTNYGPIGIMWFDSRVENAAQANELIALVKSLQPDCLVNSRVGHTMAGYVGNDFGDYRITRDNQIPDRVLPFDFESPVTMNETWGYSSANQDWKSASTLIRQLAHVAAKNGNYLLNVGPTALGEIPEQSVTRLREVGRWMKVSGEAIYGAGPSPIPHEFEWGVITTKPGKLYLHVIDWREGLLQLTGLRNKVRSAYLLADPGRALTVAQSHEPGIDLHSLSVTLPPKAPDPHVSVIALEIDGAPDADTRLTQRPEGNVILPASLADVHGPGDLQVHDRGAVQGWRNTGDWLSWRFLITQAGAFRITLLTSDRNGNWAGGQEVAIGIAGRTIRAVLKENGRSRNSLNPKWNDVRSPVGQIQLDKSGVYEINLKPLRLPSALDLLAVELSVTR
jgi:alpha-L-fucosidase